MKWYQPIECDNTVKNPLVCGSSNFKDFGFTELSFNRGKEIVEWPDDIFMKATERGDDGDPDDVLQNGYMIPVFSKKLMDELIMAGIRGIQYLPIKVLSFNGDEVGIFYIANFLNFIEAFDYEKSIYNRFGDDFPNPNVRGEIAGVIKFVLRGEKIRGFDIIRLKEYDLSFFVSQRFVDVFEKNNFRGYSFRKIEIV